MATFSFKSYCAVTDAMEMLSSDVLWAESRTGSSPSQGTQDGEARKAGGILVFSERTQTISLGEEMGLLT